MAEYQGIFGDEFNAGIFGYAVVVDEQMFGVPAPAGSEAASGLGLDVPTSLGPRTFDVNQPYYCGSRVAIQQMLADLGYYKDIIDGEISPGGPSEKAIKAFAKDKGVSLASGVDKKFCEALQAAWEASKGSSVTATAPTKKTKLYAAAPKFSSVAIPAVTQEGAASETENGAGDGGWWSSASTGEKVAVVGGAAAVVGIAGWLLMRK